MDETRADAERSPGLESLETDLRRLDPGLEIVDRGLVLARHRVRGDASLRADFVALEASGSPLLVLVVDGRGDDTLLAAIDALRFARANGEYLARRPSGSPPCAVRARVALVAESFSSRARDGLALLPADELWLLEARQLESQTSSRRILVPITSPPARPSAPDRSRAAFLTSVPEPLRGTAELLIQRLSRLDAAFEATSDPASLVLRANDRAICWLDVHDGALHGALPSLGRRLRVEGPTDAHAFLDDVVREYLASLDTPPPGGWRTPNGTGPPDEPLLTPEEMAAFRG